MIASRPANDQSHGLDILDVPATTKPQSPPALSLHNHWYEVLAPVPKRALLQAIRNHQPVEAVQDILDEAPKEETRGEKSLVSSDLSCHGREF